MNCTRCQKRIEKGQPYHRTKRGPYHSECNKTVAPEQPAMPSMVASKRWERVHAGQADEPVRTSRVLIRLTVQRVGLDPHAVPLSIVFDGMHSRKIVIEGNQAWAKRYGRKALVKWFNNILASAGV